MSSGHKVIAAAFIGLTAIVVLVVVRGGACGTESATPERADPSTTERSTGGQTASRPGRPTLPEPVRVEADSGVTVSPAAQFDEEERELAWADGVEKQLRGVIDKFRIDGAGAAVACKAAICRLELTGESSAVVELADRLGEAPEVISTAESVSFSRTPNPAAVDEPIVVVYLKFKR